MCLLSIRVGQLLAPFQDLYQAVGWRKVGLSLTVPQKGNKEDINALGKLLDWNKSLISSYYDRALHPICPAAKLNARSSDLNLLGFPGTLIPGPMDLCQKEHIERPPRTNPRIPIRSNKVGFVASPVGPCQCLYGEEEFPELTPPIDPIDRLQMPCEQLYERPTDHFVELISMLVTFSDQAYQHPKPAQQILEDLTREKYSKQFQMAVVKAHNFLGISCFGGVPL